jgi:tetratricopeptide (TPR) repeat protein
MSNIEVMLAGYDSPKSPNAHAEKFRRLYPMFRTVVRAQSLETREAKRVFQLALKKDPNSSLAHLGLGIAFKNAGEYGPALQSIQVAFKEWPDSIPVMRCLAEAYQLNGEDSQAIALLKQALDRDGTDKSTLFLLASFYMDQEDYEEAVGIYDKLATMAPVKNEVFYNLGVCHGRQNRLVWAHYYFGIYFKQRKEPEKAQFHFKKSLDLAKDDPIMQTRIKKAM